MKNCKNPLFKLKCDKMSQIKDIFKNTSWMTVSQIITSIFGFVWTIIIARYLGVSDYGILSFAISFSTLINIIMDLGISTYATRELSRDRSLLSKFTNNVIPLKLILAIFLFLISWLILSLMNYNHLTIIVSLIMTIEIVLLSMTQYINAVYQAFEKLKYQAIGIILNTSVLLISVLATVYFNWGLIFIALSYVFGYIFFLTYISLKYVKIFGLPKFEFDFAFWKEITINSIPFGLTAFFYTLYFSIDVVMISYISGDYATGIYNAAYKIITVFTTFYTVYQFVIFPIMSKFFKQSKDLLIISYEKSVKYLLLIILPISIGVFYYAEPIVNLIYSNQYVLSATPVQILIWTVSFLFINGAASLFLNSIDKEYKVTKIYITAAIFNIILNTILIPYLSYDGASIATVISEILITILTVREILKTEYKPHKSLIVDVVKIILATIIVALVLEVIKVSMWLAIPIVIIVYLILILIMKILDNDDKHIIKEIID